MVELKIQNFSENKKSYFEIENITEKNEKSRDYYHGSSFFDFTILYNSSTASRVLATMSAPLFGKQ